MKRYVLTIVIIASFCGSVASGVVSGLAIRAGFNRADFNFWLTQQSVNISGGRSVSARSGYSLCLDHTGVVVYHTNMMPVVTVELGPDAKPLYAGFDTDVTSPVSLPLWLTVSACGILGLLSGGLAALWLKTRQSRGFAVQRSLQDRMRCLKSTSDRQLAAG